MIFINVKTIRKIINFLLDLIYFTSLKKPFLWLLSRLPFNYLYGYLWINSPSLFSQNDFKVIYRNQKMSQINIKSIENKLHPSFQKYPAKDLTTCGLTIDLRRIK